MYLGSVRFFKHVILVIIIIAILIPVLFCVRLAMINSENSVQIENLESAVSSLKAAAVLTAPPAAEQEPPETTTTPVPAKPPGAGVTSAHTTTPEPVTESTPPEPETQPLQTYANLFPDMYPDNYGAVMPEYIDDTGYVYLTFDDGPSAYTGDILAYMDKYGIKATFFVVPQDTQTCAAMLKRIAESGHSLGVHTFSHVYKDIYASPEAYFEDFNRAFSLIYQQTGVKPFLFRFPGGSVNDYNADVRDVIVREMTRRGFVYFDWNVDSRDAYDAGWTEMYNTVLGEVAQSKRSVVLFHDRPGGANTVLVLEDIIQALKNNAAGYTFDRITEWVRPMQF